MAAVSAAARGKMACPADSRVITSVPHPPTTLRYRT